MATDWRSELRRTWSLQPRPKTGDPVIHAHVLTPGAGRPLRVHTTADGARHLLVPGDARWTEPIRGQALDCEVRELVFDGRPDRFLDIACRRPELFEVFDELLASILADAASSGDPMASAAAMLRRWRDLLRAWAATISHEREMGLYAELHVLELATQRASAVSPAIWRGPLREPKDIVAADWWVEVKAVAETRSGLWINGVEQLAEVPGATGYLTVLTVAEDAAGRTVDELAEILRARVADPSAFDELLLQAGWVSHDDAHRWSATGTDVVPSVSCPRLGVDPAIGVPAGVGRVRYELDVAVLRSRGLRDAASELLRLGERL